MQITIIGCKLDGRGEVSHCLDVKFDGMNDKIINLMYRFSELGEIGWLGRNNFDDTNNKMIVFACLSMFHCFGHFL
jgi:hypothetical protein